MKEKELHYNVCLTMQQSWICTAVCTKFATFEVIIHECRRCANGMTRVHVDLWLTVAKQPCASNFQSL